MARRSIILGWLFVPALIASGLALAQYPGRNIPPTRVPETAEPDLADPKTPGELPEKMRPSIIGQVAPTPPGLSGIPAKPVGPVSVDPPIPVVSIHVDAPASTSAGADVEYKIRVENRSQAPAHHVKVTNPIPEGTGLHLADPTGDETTQKYVAWKLGTLKPGEGRTIRVIFRPLKDGLEAIENTARVQFEHGQKVRTILKRPQLVLKKTSHHHALEKQGIACKLVVENTGEVEVLNIEVNEQLQEGLHFEEKDAATGRANKWLIPALGAKQKKEFTYTVVGEKAGTLGSTITATAERGAKATHDWQVTVGPSPLTVKMTGPDKIYLNYPATYQIQMNYSGLIPLDNVVVAFTLPKGMKVVRASPGSQSFADRLQWPIQRLNPKESRSFTVAVQTATPGVVPNFVKVLWHGPEQHAEATTEFLGATALHLDLRESNDPVRVGEKVRYTLTVSNSGTKAATDVKLLVTFPLTQFVVDVDGTDGKSLPGGVQEIILPEVPAKGRVTKAVLLKATAAGRAVLHVEMESSELPAGNVTKEEPTTITE